MNELEFYIFSIHDKIIGKYVTLSFALKNE